MTSRKSPKSCMITTDNTESHSTSAYMIKDLSTFSLNSDTSPVRQSHSLNNFFHMGLNAVLMMKLLAARDPHRLEFLPFDLTVDASICQVMRRGFRRGRQSLEFRKSRFIFPWPPTHGAVRATTRRFSVLQHRYGQLGPV